jgi:hypothetical protein
MVHPRRHGLYFQDENIQVFITGIEKGEKKFTTRLDKVVAMKLEAVPVGFPVPHPLRSSGEDWTPTIVTGDLQGDLTPVHRSNEEDLGLAVAPYALGELTGLPIASHCHDHKYQEKARKKEKRIKRPDSIRATSPALLPNLSQVGRQVSSPTPICPPNPSPYRASRPFFWYGFDRRID